MFAELRQQRESRSIGLDFFVERFCVSSRDDVAAPLKGFRCSILLLRYVLFVVQFIANSNYPIEHGRALIAERCINEASRQRGTLKCFA